MLLFKAKGNTHKLDRSTSCDLEAQNAWNSRCGAATDHQKDQIGLKVTRSEVTSPRGPNRDDRTALCLQIRHPIQKNAKNLEIVSASGFGLELRAPWSDFNIVGLFGKPQTSTFSKYTVCLGFHHCSRNGGYDTDFDLASSQFWRKVKPPNTNITFVPLLFSGVSINTRLCLIILGLMNTNSYEKTNKRIHVNGSSAHFHGENQNKLIRTRPIAPNFIRCIAKGHI